MVNKTIKRVIPIILSVLLMVTAIPLQLSVSAAAKTVIVLDGQVSVTDSVGNGAESNGTVTITATGSTFSKKTNNVTITNETDSKATLKFDYSASDYNSFEIADATANASGTYSVLLEAGASVTIAIQSNSGSSLFGTVLTATLTLSNFSLTAAAESSNVTVEFDSALGSVTVDDSAVESGYVKEDVASGTSVALVATANSGVTFYGWIDADTGSILSKDVSCTVTPAADITVKPVFINSNSAPYFGVGSVSQKSFSYGLLGMSKGYYDTVNCTYLFDNLNAAATFADASATSKGIVLMNNGTLPAGDYTIPSGVTLLIPFDDANTMYTTAAESEGTYTAPTAYRTLTLASGANITVDGVISVSGQHHYAQGKAPTDGGGTPIGKVGFIKMSGNSNITVNKGGKLYVYGFVTGTGSITANSGATVYENFQIMDFRGGTQSTKMENGVFPISQYYVQNIEVPLTLESGAIEYGLTTIYMSSTEFMSAVAFIGPSGSMFNLASGYIVKAYDGTTDRLNIELNGDMTVSPINLSVGTSTLDSEEYELAVNGNITVDVKNGSNITIGQDMALLPGSEILIAEGAECTLGSGINFYIYDADEWDTFVFTNKDDVTFTPVKYAPGRTYTRTAADLVDAKIQVDGTIDASQGYVYTTTGGANIYSTGTGVATVTNGTQTTTHQFKQASSTYVQIPITPAKFKNADGTYLTSGNSTTNPNAYAYKDGKWVCDYSYIDSSSDVTGHTYESVVTESTCTEGGYTTHTCSACGDSYVDSETAAGHTAGADATCTTAQTCTVCGTELVAALGHSYTSVEIEVECDKDGYTEHTCVKCGDTYNSDTVAALGHSYNAVVTKPTCIEGGYTTHTCANCGDSYVDSETEANGHTAGADATCTEAQTCTVCGAELTAALGHNYGAEVTEPTCTEGGYTTHTCANCGDSYVDSETEANGHSYSDFTVDVEATHSEEGSKSATCGHCGDVKTETIPVIVCDIDGDSITGKAEYIRIRLFLFGLRTPDDAEFVMFDMNDDKVINVLDYIYIYNLAEQNGVEL